jgi:cytosine/adenosine deaminase-related metal-dependent hydrolase
LRFLTADYVFPVLQPPVKNGVVIVRQDGSIEDVLMRDALSPEVTPEKFEGILCPGFVNAHCHLELSCLKDKIPAGTGLIGFFRHLLEAKKKVPIQEKTISAAMADRQMAENGIVAVGDIASDADCFAIKSNSRLHYHTFIELYDLTEERTEEIFRKGNHLLEALPHQQASLTPHAPYSVTRALADKILASGSAILSIHHAESRHEKPLLEDGTGKMAEYLKQYVQKDFARKEGFAPAEYFITRMNSTQSLLLVHNTYVDQHTIKRIESTGKKIWWCFCPKANLYIEGRSVDFALFRDVEKCCLGTDSLASNNTLSILEEMKALLRLYPEMSMERLIRWATLNGAMALGFHHQLGSFQKNKKPGVILIEKTDGCQLLPESTVRRLV